MKIGFRTSLVHVAQGLLMGGADIIPGVSGGTMALIVGIYTRLIDSLSSAFSVVLSLLRADVQAAREHFSEIEWRLIVPLLFGIGVAIVIGAKVIPVLIERYPIHSNALFLGLVAASLAIPWQRIRRPHTSLLLIALVAAVIAFLLVGLPPQAITEPGPVQIFGAAAVAICAMILPGVSGSFLLKAMGMYEATLNAINGREVGYIFLFGLGAALGLGAFSKLLDYLLEKQHDVTMAALLGLMAGSLRALWPYQEADRTLRLPDPGEPVLSVILVALVGFAFVSALAWYEARNRQEEPQPKAPTWL